MTAPSPASRSLLRTPPVSWPTLALALAVSVAWVLSLALATHGRLPVWVCGVLSTVAAYVAFTPMHDAAHRTVCRVRWLNELVGHFSGLVLMAPFAAFRHVHLTHHQHTNVADPMVDPDYWSGMGKGWTRPLHWMTQDLFYYVYVLRMGKRLPMALRLEVWASAATFYGLALVLWAIGFGETVLFCWMLPARIAITALSFAFNFLPHWPYEATRAEDRMRATSVLSSPLLTPFFLCQNYHLIHHLYPGVPFYRYSRVWRWQRGELLAQGARERTFRPSRTQAQLGRVQGPGSAGPQDSAPSRPTPSH